MWPHWVMFTLVFIKSVSLLLEAGRYHLINEYGSEVLNGWAISYYVFLLYVTRPTLPRHPKGC